MAHKASKTAGSASASRASSTSPSTGSAGGAVVVNSGTGSPVPINSAGSTGARSSTGVVNPGLTSAGVPSPKKNGMEAKIAARLNGLENYLPADVSLTLNGQSFTVAQLIQSFQSMDGLYTALTAAEQQSKVAITQARQAVNAELPGFEPLLTGLDNTLRGYFGKGNPMLQNFGIATGARKKPSSTTLAGAAATAKLTREARNTLGPKAKLEVTGGKAAVQLVAPDGSALGGSTLATPPPAAPASPPVAGSK